MTATIEIADHTSGFPVLPVTPPKTVTIFDKKVMIALPWYKQAHPVTAFCVAQLMDKRRTSSVLNFGDAFIAHSRNSIADTFLKSGLDYLLSVDDDMVLPIGNAAWFKAYSGWDWMPDQFAGLNTLDRLMSHKKSVIGGTYFGRYAKGKPVFAQGSDVNITKLSRTAPIDRILEVGWCGTGCLLVHRQVFLDVEKRFPRLARGTDGKGGQWFTSSEHSLLDEVDRAREMLSKGQMDGPKALRAYEILEGAVARARQSGLGQGEDVAFCKRAQEAGHKIFVDLGCVCGHIGYTCFGPRNTFE